MALIRQEYFSDSGWSHAAKGYGRRSAVGTFHQEKQEYYFGYSGWQWDLFYSL
jgi:hypothetical protein